MQSKRRVIKRLKIVQIIGKYFACDENGAPDYNAIESNILLAEKAAIELWNSGVVGVFTPHLNMRHFELKAKAPEENYKYFDATILREAVEAVLRLPNWKDSSGSVEELKICEEEGIPIFDNTGDLIAWAKKQLRTL